MNFLINTVFKRIFWSICLFLMMSFFRFFSMLKGDVNSSERMDSGDLMERILVVSLFSAVCLMILLTIFASKSKISTDEKNK